MYRINDEFLDCVFYLYPTKEDAIEGRKLGASGFLVSLKSESDLKFPHIYAVTNRHVIRPLNNLSRDTVSLFIRLNTKEGKTEIIPTTSEDWIPHPNGDEIAVMPLPILFSNLRFKTIPSDTLVSESLVEKFNIGPGDEVFMVGRFINHEGKQRNLPSVRFGNISMMPLEPIISSWGMAQESFTVEMRSLSGYSGSPVFVHMPRFVQSRHGSIPEGYQPGDYLLGIDWCHINFKSQAVDDNDLPIEVWVKLNTGVAGVVPAWKIKEIFYEEELIKRREKDEEEYLNQLGGTVIVASKLEEDD